MHTDIHKSGIFRILSIFGYSPRVRKLKQQNVMTIHGHVVAYPKFLTVEYLIHVSCRASNIPDLQYIHA